MEMKICDLPSIHRLARAECKVLANQIKEIEGELDTRPFLFERITLCSKRDAMIQELRCLKIKTENLSREMDYAKKISHEGNTIGNNHKRLI